MSIDGIRARRRVFTLAGTPRQAPAVPLVAAADFGSEQFVPPHQMAAQDEQQPQPPAEPEPPLPPKQGRRSFKQWIKARTKKQWIIFGIAAVLLIGGGIAVYLLTKSAPPVKPNITVKKAPPPPPPTTEAANLTGLQVGFDVNKRPVTAVMIENSLDARPQSGIDQAGVVFEAVAEGGITRFMALFQDTDPGYIGPVRSVRPYYLTWATGFDAAIAHAGGSAEALANIKSWGVKDLNHDAAHFYRVNNRYAPHNLYTDITKLRDYAAQKGFGESKYTGFLRKAEAPSKTPTAKAMQFTISSSSFNPSFAYDPADNSYARSQAGAPHMTIDGAGAQAQIKPKVVVALVVPQGKQGIYTTYATTGTGSAYIFQDGVVTEVTWAKADRNTNITFTDAAGKAVKLNPGKTWISIVGGKERVAYQP